MKILVVEDAADVSKLLVSALADEGHEVVSAEDGLAAIEEVWRFKPDLVLLDIGLPIVDGLTVLRRLRERDNQVAVILITGRVEDEDKVEGLSAGADDYICKPFSLNELRARIAAVHRRLERPSSSVLELRFDDLVVNLLTRKAARAGKDLELTTRELAVLQLLMENPQVPITRDVMGQKLWGRLPDPKDRTVEVVVSRLRKKLDLPGLPSLIVTTRNSGYSIGLPAHS